MAGKRNSGERPAFHISPAELVRLHEMAKQSGLVTAIVLAMGLAMEALEDRSGIEWTHAGVDIVGDEIALRFRRRQKADQRKQE